MREIFFISLEMKVISPETVSKSGFLISSLLKRFSKKRFFDFISPETVSKHGFLISSLLRRSSKIGFWFSSLERFFLSLLCFPALFIFSYNSNSPVKDCPLLRTMVMV